MPNAVARRRGPLLSYVAVLQVGLERYHAQRYRWSHVTAWLRHNISRLPALCLHYENASAVCRHKASGKRTEARSRRLLIVEREMVAAAALGLPHAADVLIFASVAHSGEFTLPDRPVPFTNWLVGVVQLGPAWETFVGDPSVASVMHSWRDWAEHEPDVCARGLNLVQKRKGGKLWLYPILQSVALQPMVAAYTTGGRDVFDVGCEFYYDVNRSPSYDGLVRV